MARYENAEQEWRRLTLERLIESVERREIDALPEPDAPKPRLPDIPVRPREPQEPIPRELPRPEETPLSPGAPPAPEPVAPPEVTPPSEPHDLRQGFPW